MHVRDSTSKFTSPKSKGSKPTDLIMPLFDRDIDSHLKKKSPSTVPTIKTTAQIQGLFPKPTLPVNAAGVVLVEFASPLPKPPRIIDPNGSSVLVPIAMFDADGSKDTLVLLIVIAAPLGVSIWLTGVSPGAKAMTGSRATETVLLLMMILEACGVRDIVCSSCVMAGPPAFRVCVPMRKREEESAVKVWLPTVSRAGGVRVACERDADLS